MNNFNEIYNPNYKDFAKLIFHIGSSLNDRKDRFDKADLIEQGFCYACNNQLVWEDDEGFDLIDKDRNIKFELKSQTNCLFTKAGKPMEKTKKIKLTNTLQQNENKTLLPTADWLIIIDSASGAIGIIDYFKVVNNFSSEMQDGFACQIPMSEIQFLSEPIQHSIISTNEKSYKEQKQLMQKEYIKGFFK